jgi:excisionase family DNA binding protein
MPSSPEERPASRAGADPGRRFLTLADVAEILATSVAQVRALIQSGELRYIQIGGRQQYRIEAVELEDYIARMYAKAERGAAARASRGPVDGSPG